MTDFYQLISCSYGGVCQNEVRTKTNRSLPEEKSFLFICLLQKHIFSHLNLSPAVIYELSEYIWWNLTNISWHLVLTDEQ